MANEFGKGFGAGLSYFNAFAELEEKKLLNEQKLKTEELRQQSYQATIEEAEATRDVRIEGIKADTEFKTSRAEKESLLLKEYKDTADQRKEQAELILDQNRNKLKEGEATLEIALNNLEDDNQRRAMRNLINSYQMAGDESIPLNVRAHKVEESLTQVRPFMDWTKFTKDEYWQSWEKISSKLEQGDFEGIATENTEELSTIYKDSLEVFNGKQFIAKDGKKGIIKGAKLSGDFNAIENSANMLVGINYSVLFDGEEQEQNVFSYAPDKTEFAKVIKEDQEGTDAKVVSVADIVDKISAEKDFAMHMVNNRQTFDVFMKASKGYLNFKGSPEEKKAKSDIYFEQKDKALARLGTIFKTANAAQEESFDASESAFLESLYSNLPGTLASKHIVKTTDEFGDDLYEYKEGSSSGLIQEDFVDTYANSEKLTAEIENVYQNFKTFDNLLPGQKATYNFGGIINISFDKSKNYVDVTLEETLGAKYQDYKKAAESYYERVYPGKKLEDSTDMEYMAFMSDYINKIALQGK